jgi:hypothetical protein
MQRKIRVFATYGLVRTRLLPLTTQINASSWYVPASLAKAMAAHERACDVWTWTAIETDTELIISASSG